MDVLLCYVGDCDERKRGDYQGAVCGERKNRSSGRISKSIKGYVLVFIKLIIGALKLGAFEGRWVP